MRAAHAHAKDTEATAVKSLLLKESPTYGRTWFQIESKRPPAGMAVFSYSAARAPATSFVDDYSFCYLHPLPRQSLFASPSLSTAVPLYYTDLYLPLGIPSSLASS